MSDQIGMWESGGTPDVVAVHMALLRTGKVLLYTGNEENTFGNINQGKSRVWDPKTGTDTPAEINRNLFCSGHCALPDGRILVIGGQSMAQEFLNAIIWLLGLGRGTDHDVHTFDPITEQWTRHEDMPKARWYPTCTALPDGKILMTSGFAGHVLDSISRILGIKLAALNTTYEIYDPDTNTIITRGEFQDDICLYPHVHVLPGGRLFVHSVAKARFYDLATSAWLPHEFPLSSPGTRTYPGMCSCALMPINWDGYGLIRLFIAGGSVDANPHHESPATDGAAIFVYDRDHPQNSLWRETTPLPAPRFLNDTVLLPDETILVVNGAGRGIADHNHDEIRAVELFDPATESWHHMAEMNVNRLYHATAVLLPDARVLVGGSTGHQFPRVENEFQLEIFSPPYLCKGERPIITTAPETISYGSTFEVETPDAQTIASAVLIRPSVVTHNNNMDQRCIRLSITEHTGNTLTLAAPLDSTIAPPGYYMLFLVNENGVPSEAPFVRVC